jgi:prolyl oligopeptidase
MTTQHTTPEIALPPTRREDNTEILHGVAVADPYRWLEDQENRETRAWIAAQNRYAQALIGDLPERRTIAQRLEQLLRVDSIGFPHERGGRYFFARQRPEEEQATLYVRQGLDGSDTIFCDPKTLHADHKASASYLDITPDGTLAAYAIREGGDDRITVCIREVDTLQDLPDRLPKDHYSAVSFTRDGIGFYYTRLMPLVGRRVYYHALGTDVAQDVEVFGAGYGPEVILSDVVSENGRWLLLVVYRGWAQNDLYLQDIQSKDGVNGLVLPVVQGVPAAFTGDFAGDILVVRTDWQAPNRRILAVDLNALTTIGQTVGQQSGEETPERWLASWKEIVPEGPDPIESHSLVGGKLFVETLHHVTSQIRIYGLSGEVQGEIALPGPGSASVPYGHWNSAEAFYSYGSFTVPDRTYRYDVGTGTSTLWAQPQVPFVPEDFETKQVWCTSKDGTQVPMFLVGRRGVAWDGARPTLLYAYGGFNASLTPFFNPAAVLLAERGGIYALANLRGGGEFGEAWHHAGMGANKQNVFDDFIAAAEWLVANGVTSPDHLAIQGGSNGGLLVGAALTQRPDLYRAVVCSYPLLDMVRYHLFLQGPQWVPEYGSAADAEQFKTLYGYSPYHRVQSATRYPATLFVTGDADTRVAPLHARKMAALLQAAQSPEATDRPILLHYDTEAGHSAGEPTAKRIKTQSFLYTFLFQQLGIE